MDTLSQSYQPKKRDANLVNCRNLWCHHNYSPVYSYSNRRLPNCKNCLRISFPESKGETITQDHATFFFSRSLHTDTVRTPTLRPVHRRHYLIIFITHAGLALQGIDILGKIKLFFLHLIYFKNFRQAWNTCIIHILKICCTWPLAISAHTWPYFSMVIIRFSVLIINVIFL